MHHNRRFSRAFHVTDTGGGELGDSGDFVNIFCYAYHLWMKLLTETVPVNNSLLTGTVPVNNSQLTGTVPVNNSLLTGTL